MHNGPASQLVAFSVRTDTEKPALLCNYTHLGDALVLGNKHICSAAKNVKVGQVRLPAVESMKGDFGQAPHWGYIS